MLEGAFVPVEPAMLAVSVDGSLGAIQESSRISIVDLAEAGVAFAEIGIGANRTDIGWVGTLPRLLVVSQLPTHTSVHLIDPHGPRTLAETKLEVGSRLVATVGSHALIGGPRSVVLAIGEAAITQYQMPSRTLPRAAGAAANMFVVSLGTAIEEWDPGTRMPRRRFRLPGTAAIGALGGSDRVLWTTSPATPNRIDVIPLVNRGQPKQHELAEPIASLSSHPRSDLLVAVGAESGRVYVIDLDGRGATRELPGVAKADAAALVVGRGTAVLAVRAGEPLVLAALDGRAVEPARRTSSSAAIAVPVVEEPVKSSLYDEEDAPVVKDDSLSSRIGGWRERRAAAKPAPVAFANAPGAEPVSWRDDLLAWAKDASGALPVELTDLAARHQLAALAPALGLAYAAHLLGERGAIPAEVARLVGWAEALGTGELKKRGVAQLVDSRLRLADHVLAELDGAP